MIKKIRKKMASLPGRLSQDIDWRKFSRLFLILTVISLFGSLPFVMRVLCMTGFMGLLFFEGLFGAGLLPNEPVVAWALSGLVVGAGAALWTIAPAFGWRKTRWLTLGVPFILLFCLGSIGYVKTIAQPRANPITAPPVN
jgi:hypothetical protein